MTLIFPPSRTFCGLFWVTLFCLFGAGCGLAPVNGRGVEVVVLGTAQDAGLPHIGCEKANCELARAEGRREKVAALGVQGHSGWWLLDATPDLPAQIQAMGGLPNAIFLTHAHIGHYTGLMYLGREALGAHKVPVWCSQRLADFLRNNGPWEQLIQLQQIELHILPPNTPVELEPGLSLTALPVPHRDEYSDTYGFQLHHQNGRSLLFIPDIDQWHQWPRQLIDFLQPDATLLLDGTFYSGAELPHRDLSEIPHPLVSSTMDQLETLPQLSQATTWPCQIGFIHLNHSNPLWNASSAESADLHQRGFFVAREGMRFALSDSPVAKPSSNTPAATNHAP
jgi:pyrroloquinoline quinone biosynthesis protein B